MCFSYNEDYERRNNSKVCVGFNYVYLKQILAKINDFPDGDGQYTVACFALRNVFKHVQFSGMDIIMISGTRFWSVPGFWEIFGTHVRINKSLI